MAKTPRVDIMTCNLISSTWTRAEWQGKAILVYHYGLWEPTWKQELPTTYKVTQTWDWKGLRFKESKFMFVDGRPETVFKGSPENNQLINMYETAVYQHIFEKKPGIERYERIRSWFWRVVWFTMIALVLALLFGCFVALPL